MRLGCVALEIASNPSTKDLGICPTSIFRTNDSNSLSPSSVILNSLRLSESLLNRLVLVQYLGNDFRLSANNISCLRDKYVVHNEYAPNRLNALLKLSMARKRDSVRLRSSARALGTVHVPSTDAGNISTFGKSRRIVS